jgi:hypothetical protein
MKARAFGACLSPVYLFAARLTTNVTAQCLFGLFRSFRPTFTAVVCMMSKANI